MRQACKEFYCRTAESKGDALTANLLLVGGFQLPQGVTNLDPAF